MIRRPPRSTLFPYRRSSDLEAVGVVAVGEVAQVRNGLVELVAGHLVQPVQEEQEAALGEERDRKSTRLNSSHANISYAVFCLKKKNNKLPPNIPMTNHR